MPKVTVTRESLTKALNKYTPKLGWYINTVFGIPPVLEVEVECGACSCIPPPGKCWMHADPPAPKLPKLEELRQETWQDDPHFNALNAELLWKVNSLIRRENQLNGHE